MLKMCPKCVLAIGTGLLIGIGLALCAKGCHLWSVLGVGLGVGICMAVGERLPKVDNDDDHHEHHATGL